MPPTTKQIGTNIQRQINAAREEIRRLELARKELVRRPPGRPPKVKR